MCALSFGGQGTQHLLMTKTCDICGSTFTITDFGQNSRKRCSDECSRVADRDRRRKWRQERNRVIKQCASCGIDFSTTNNRQRYCAPDCSRDAQLVEHEPKTCKGCSRTFTPGVNFQVYCTPACRAQSRKRGHQAPIGSQQVCPKCGRTFVKQSSRQTYCADACDPIEQAQVREAERQAVEERRRLDKVWAMRIEADRAKEVAERAARLAKLIEEDEAEMPIINFADLTVLREEPCQVDLGDGPFEARKQYWAAV